jgi:hypothetical protein
VKRQEQRDAEPALVFERHLDRLHGLVRAHAGVVLGDGDRHQYLLARKLAQTAMQHLEYLRGIGEAIPGPGHRTHESHAAFGAEHRRVRQEATACAKSLAAMLEERIRHRDDVGFEFFIQSSGAGHGFCSVSSRRVLT